MNRGGRGCPASRPAARRRSPARTCRPVVAHHHGVRARAVGKVVLPELAGHGVEHGGVVGALSDEPDAAVRGDVGVARAALLPGDFPLFQRGVGSLGVVGQGVWGAWCGRGLTLRVALDNTTCCNIVVTLLVILTLGRPTG